MESHNLAKQKADLIYKQALLLLPRDKQNIQSGKRIVSINQWMIGQAEVNFLETDTVSSAFLLSQKWPFELLKGSRFSVYAFMAGNDTLGKQKFSTEKSSPKSRQFHYNIGLLNLMLLFRTSEKDQPYISMMAANSLLESLKDLLSSKECEAALHIRWKHDILLQTMKVGEISFKHAKVQGQFYSQLSKKFNNQIIGIEVNVKSIPKNFGAYDFQPTYLEKHINTSIDLKELAQTIINNFLREVCDDKSIYERRKQIKDTYQAQLIYLDQKVTIYDRKYEHIHYTGKFVGVDQQGNALLEGYKKPFEDGVIKFNTEAKDYLSLYRGDY